MMKVYSEVDSGRCDYVFSFFFGYIRREWEYVDSPESADVVYSAQRPGTGATWIYCDQSILGESAGFEKLYPQAANIIASGEAAKDFDLVAFVFHALSRMEEYTDVDRDEHDRYKYTSSMLHKYDLLKYPVVDMLVSIYLGQYVILKNDICYTLDVDTAFYYLGKDPIKNLVLNVSDITGGDFSSLKKRWKVRTGRQTDPYVQNIRDFLSQQRRAPKEVFWLMSSDTEYDPQVTFRYRYHQKLIIETNNQAPVSLHASYSAYTDAEKIQEEKDFLQAIIETEVTKNRFHYLRLKFPESYQALVKVNIKEDWTMGYPDTNGFRAGTTRKFYWYDVSRDAQTSLIVVPFQYIDLAPAEELPEFEGTKTKVYHNFNKIKLD